MIATITDNTFDALLGTVCDNPGDATPMLVLADWMDENRWLGAGAAMMWAAVRGKWPIEHSDPGWLDGPWWYWLFMGTEDSPGTRVPRPSPPHCFVPDFFKNASISSATGSGHDNQVKAWIWFIDRFNELHAENKI
jgi:uncharacterized protein (TIGR02996 family)